MVDGAAGEDRRRFLKKAGVAAGAAWVAPVVLTVPTPAGAQSVPVCLPSMLPATVFSSCEVPYAAWIDITVSSETCVFFYEIYKVYDYAGYVLDTACTGPVSSFSKVVNFVPGGGARGAVDVRIFDSCDPGTRTELGTLQSTHVELCN